MAKSIAITDTKQLAKLVTRVRQNRRPASSDLRKIHGIDTETHKGNIFLIADSDGRFLDNITIDSVLSFLFHKKYQGTWNFFYNMEHDANSILKLLPKKTLITYKKKRELRFKYKKFNIYYIPKKVLTIRRGHHSVVFYDVAQFYHESLSKAYESNIGKLPKEYLNMKDKRAKLSPSFYAHNKKMIQKYCIQDCIYTKRLGEHWARLFHDAYGFYPKRWVSSGYLAEKVLVNNHLPIPLFHSIPYEIQDFAYKTFFGGRFEILKRGFIGKAYLYDINSAYPHALSKFPSLSNGKWIKSKKIHSKALLGFFKILANIPDEEYFPPFSFRANNIVIFPTGKFITYVTLAELQACKNRKWFKILDSWQFVSSKVSYPFQKFIKTMYKKRLALKRRDDPMQLPVKIILNSIYGKMGQKTRRVIGSLFNPVIFSFITGFVRAQLCRFIIQNKIERQVVSLATDSVGTTKKLNVNSKELGIFSCVQTANDAYFLQNGFYRLDGKWKQRGLGNLGSKEIEHLETIERDGKLYYKFRVLRSKKLRSAILQDKIKEVGDIKPFEREVNLNADRKRFWPERLESIDSKIMNDSMPVSLNHFDKDMV